MKKIIFSLLTMTSSFVLSAQTGVGTINPQGTFHVDGAKDNPATGVPSSVQQSNDFIITPQGNVGVGTTQPNTSAILDVNVNNLPANAKKGLLLPKVALASNKDITTIPNPAHGLIVYNTATAGTAPDIVIKDNIYRYDTTLIKWIKLMDEVSPGSSQVSTILGFDAKPASGSGNTISYLGSDLGGGANIRQLMFDNTILANNEVATYDETKGEFTANKTGFFNFQINMLIKGTPGSTDGTAIVRLGISKTYTGNKPTTASNNSFGFFSQIYGARYTPEVHSILSTGMIKMNKDDKIIFLMRYVDPAVNTLDVESLNYDRTYVNSASVTYIAL